MTVDYIIIGQGLSGTFLSWTLINAGKTVIVIDEDRQNTATKVASGIINPVTGRRIVRTWCIEELLPFALDDYTRLGNELNADLLTVTSLLDFHTTLQMKEAFEKRLPDEKEYLHLPENPGDWTRHFNSYFGLGQVAPCILIDLHTMLAKWRNSLKQHNFLLEEKFSWEHASITPGAVTYKDIKAEKIFCCEGVEGFSNPYFKNLPYSHMKGEVLVASIPGLPRTHIYKCGLSIVPWQDDLFWVGSSYEWKFENLLPTDAFRKRTEALLQQFLKLPYTIVDHFAADRPSNMERRPFVGLHPHHPSVGILNGMGTKGCSLAPFFAKQLTDHLVSRSPIYADADVKRFDKVFARDIKTLD
ncbi:MAG: dependent oxidoreductase [Segetibacter sp.]|nr:dependent oxidoreductase [Segetibacter sp.]